MRFTRLSDWLHWQEGLNPRAIDLGLDRIREVAMRMNLNKANCPVITVGGTNGKGSCAAYLEAILAAAGYRVAAYVSPHIRRYNERIRLAGTEVSDEQLCAAFDAVDRGRGDIPLTYFEFGTLAAFKLIKDGRFDVAILEVGLGGRLDAVNLLDTDVAIVASVGLDHTDWLGNDRESIGFEKAGIFRAGRPAVCGDRRPPDSLIKHARAIGAELYCLGRDFNVEHQDGFANWSWKGWDESLYALPLPALAGPVQLQNAACVLAALRLIRPKFSVTPTSIAQGLKAAGLPGRFEIIAGDVPVVLDVAHNAEACAVLAENLSGLPATGRTLAVFGMLQDKPVEAVAQTMDRLIDAWYVGGLETQPRGLDGVTIARRLGTPRGSVSVHGNVVQAYREARANARKGDRIVIFGSFHTLEAVWEIVHGRSA